MTAIKNQKIVTVPFENIINTKKDINIELYELANLLAMKIEKN